MHVRRGPISTGQCPLFGSDIRTVVAVSLDVTRDPYQPGRNKRAKLDEEGRGKSDQVGKGFHPGTTTEAVHGKLLHCIVDCHLSVCYRLPWLVLVDLGSSPCGFLVEVKWF